jgi:hypothetical protein
MQGTLRVIVCLRGKRIHAVLQVSTNIILRITMERSMAVLIRTEASLWLYTTGEVPKYLTHGSVGKHALGDRARKIDQGILITRFELPFNIWW